eukprot:gb/GECG01007174.1/.p1 GENE.gb/GECG01007174.1/~~gb/GECG01007174.1/.p1  ORF type:complete len:525 (+),score=48.86 gb/GECG01007174.1/:1-1575(+)
MSTQSGVSESKGGHSHAQEAYGYTEYSSSSSVFVQSPLFQGRNPSPTHAGPAQDWARSSRKHAPSLEVDSGIQRDAGKKTKHRDGRKRCRCCCEEGCCGCCCTGKAWRLPILADLVEDRVYSRTLTVTVFTMVGFIAASLVTHSILRDPYNLPRSEWHVVQQRELSGIPPTVNSGERIPTLLQIRFSGVTGVSAVGIHFDLSVTASTSHLSENHLPLVENSMEYLQAKFLMTPHMDGPREFTTDSNGILSVNNLTFAGSTADVKVRLRARSNSFLPPETAQTLTIIRMFRLVNDITSITEIASDATAQTDGDPLLIGPELPLPAKRFLLQNAQGKPLARRQCQLVTKQFSYPGSEEQINAAVFSHAKALSNHEGIATFDSATIQSASTTSHMIVVNCGGFSGYYNTLPFHYEDAVHTLEWVSGPSDAFEEETSSSPYTIRVLDAAGNPLAGKRVFANIARELDLEYSDTQPMCVYCTIPANVDSWGKLVSSVSKKLMNPISLQSDKNGIARFTNLQFFHPWPIR